MNDNWYERHLLPYLVDLACSVKPVRRQRREVVPRAKGRVLEVGIGTGLNMAHYDPALVTKIVGIDPAAQMQRLARKRIARANLDVELVTRPAEEIALPDASFDTVVLTYTLCSIPEPLAALAQMRRVLAPGGKLVFCEHGLAPDENVRRWQRRLEPFWMKVAGGCHLSRDVPALLAEAGFRCDDLRQAYVPGPRILSYNYWGEAAPAERR